MTNQDQPLAHSAKGQRRFQVREGWVVQAYRFALDPSPHQVRDPHAGAARFAFNWGLALVKANVDQRAAEKSYDIAPESLTPSLSWSLYELRKVWNTAKGERAPWWGECSKEAFNTGLANLAAALTNWSASKKGLRKGKPVGFPRFKKRHRAAKAVRFTTGAIRVEADRRHVTLPRLGTLRTHESTRKLHRRLQAGTARILSATVRREAGRWFVALQCEVQRNAGRPTHPDAMVGVDLGLKTLAVLSTGERVANPRHLEAALSRLRRQQRRLARRVGPDRRTGQRPSKGWRRQRRTVAALHARVAHLRANALHQFTTALTRTYGTIVVEDLHVAGMLKNRRLARHLAGASFGEIRRQLAYKTGWNGGKLVVADRWYPSSKTCSSCQTVKAKLLLGERVFECGACGLVIDRDLNAARNLASLAEAIAGPGAAGPTPPPLRVGRGNARGADRKTRPGLAGGVEARTSHPPNPRRGKTRTVAPRGRFTEQHRTQ